MPKQVIVTYGCPVCHGNFQWNKANPDPVFCPLCGATLPQRKADINSGTSVTASASKGSFAIGGFDPT